METLNIKVIASIDGKNKKSAPLTVKVQESEAMRLARRDKVKEKLDKQLADLKKRIEYLRKKNEISGQLLQKVGAALVRLEEIRDKELKEFAEASADDWQDQQTALLKSVEQLENTIDMLEGEALKSVNE